MNISAMQPGDVVKIDVRGHICFATVDGKPEDGYLPVHPHDRTCTYRRVTARQVREHYRKMGRPRAPRGVRAVTPLSPRPRHG